MGSRPQLQAVANFEVPATACDGTVKWSMALLLVATRCRQVELAAILCECASLSPDGRSSGADGAERVVAVPPSSRTMRGGPRCGRDVRATSPVGREWSATPNLDAGGPRRPTTITMSTRRSLRRMAKPRRRFALFTCHDQLSQRGVRYQRC